MKQKKWMFVFCKLCQNLKESDNFEQIISYRNSSPQHLLSTRIITHTVDKGVQRQRLSLTEWYVRINKIQRLSALDKSEHAPGQRLNVRAYAKKQW